MVSRRHAVFTQFSLPTVFQKQETVRQTWLVPTSAESGNPPQWLEESAQDVPGGHRSECLPLTLCQVRLRVSHRVVRTRGIRRALCCPRRWTVPRTLRKVPPSGRTHLSQPGTLFLSPFPFSFPECEQGNQANQPYLCSS